MKYSFKHLFLIFILFSTGFVSAQNSEKSFNLTQKGALKLANRANLEAEKLNKNVSIAVLNSSSVTLILLKGDNVSQHNTEASRRKAYTSVSTKTQSFILMKNAADSTDAKNLNTLPELLLLGGGVPVWKDGDLVGGIGVSGGGGSENDDNIAMKAIQNSGYSVTKN